MGTPSYMAPEQARGEVERLDERCDVFALGSILCEIFTGEPGFIGRSSGEIQRKASHGELQDAVNRPRLPSSEPPSRYPDDAWANFELATLLRYAMPPQGDDAIRYYTAARALRPETGFDLAEMLQAQPRR